MEVVIKSEEISTLESDRETCRHILHYANDFFQYLCFLSAYYKPGEVRIQCYEDDDTTRDLIEELDEAVKQSRNHHESGTNVLPEQGLMSLQMAEHVVTYLKRKYGE